MSPDTTSLRHAERRLALSYASVRERKALDALFALDDVLANILRSTREPLIGQMRLTWWYEALCALDTALPPAEPVLRALHADALAFGVTGAGLAPMIDGWEVLLDGEQPDDAAFDRFAQARGAGMFAAIATILGAQDPQIARAGEGWALADLASHTTDPAIRSRAAALACQRLEPSRWSRPGRVLGALTMLARFDIADRPPPVAGPRRVARLAMLRLTGR